MTTKSLRTIKTDPCSYVVLYKEEYYVWYKNNNAGMAQLISSDGTKYSGTPDPKKLQVVSSLPHIEYNNSLYFYTKIGVFSATTGKEITHPKIIELFD